MKTWVGVGRWESLGRRFTILGKELGGGQQALFLLACLEPVSFVNCRNRDKQKRKTIKPTKSIKITHDPITQR